MSITPLPMEELDKPLCKMMYDCEDCPVYFDCRRSSDNVGEAIGFKKGMKEVCIDDSDIQLLVLAQTGGRQ